MINIVDALLGEHAVLYVLFDQFEEQVAQASSVADVQHAAAPLSAVLLSHAKIEDELVFPALEKAIGPGGPLTVMREEHDEIDATLARIGRAVDVESAIAEARTALDAARDHFAKEERALFGMVRDAVADDDLLRLGDQWANLRKIWL